MKIDTLRWVILLLSVQPACAFGSASAIVFSEIMYHPASENQDQEYIELFNGSDAAVDLTG